MIDFGGMSFGCLQMPRLYFLGCCVFVCCVFCVVFLCFVCMIVCLSVVFCSLWIARTTRDDCGGLYWLFFGLGVLVGCALRVMGGYGCGCCWLFIYFRIWWLIWLVVVV